MPPICIAAAQSVSIPGDIAANVQEHLRFIAQARHHGVDMLVFPELSLTGYELPRLQACCLTPQDPRLAPLREAAQEVGMSVVVGAPVPQAGHSTPAIGAITFAPDGGVSLYCKQHLHAGEEAYASPGQEPSGVQALGRERCVLAICADTSNPRHAQAAADRGASLYMASVLVSEGGYANDAAQLQAYATRHGFAVLMANHGAPSGGFASAGRSAFWAGGGHLVAAVPGAGRYLLVAQRDGERWSAGSVALGA